MWAMNSSVTLESAISVISSLCFEISASSRSKGPSKTSRCTSKPLPGWLWDVSPGSPITIVVIPDFSPLPTDGRCLPSVPTVSDRGQLRSRGQYLGAEPAGHQALVPPGVQVREQHGERLTDDAPAVHRYPVRAQRQAGALEGEQLADAAQASTRASSP